MINRLMRMEERIVLDGAVAAGAAAAGAGADAGGEAAAVAPDSPIDSHDTITDADNVSDDSSTGSVDPAEQPGTDDTATDHAADNVVAAMEEALNGVAADPTPLKALIVNTDINDADDLIAAAGDDIIVVTYDGETDDLQSILEELDAVSGGAEYDSIALAIHSNAGGEIFLSESEHVTADSLQSDTEQIAFFDGLGELLRSEGRIDLLSCYAGLGDAGNELIAAISDVSGAEVAASTDLTGNPGVNGDWILEKGNIDAAAVYFDSADLLSYTSYLGTEDQTLIGTETITADQQFGSSIDYYDGTDDGVANGLLAVMGSDSTSSHNYVYLYRESAEGYTLETTITLAKADNTANVALGGDSNGETLLVNIDSDLYLFQQNDSSKHSSGWSNVSSFSAASTSRSFSTDYLSIDILADTLIVGNEGADSNVGEVLIFEKYFDNCSKWDLTADLSAVLTPAVDAGSTPNFGYHVQLVDADQNGTADQAFITTSSGDSAGGIDGVKDGIYYSTADAWGLAANNTELSVNTEQHITINDTNNLIFTAPASTYTKNVEVLVSGNATDGWKEDIFIAHINDGGENNITILSGDIDTAGATPNYAFTQTGSNTSDIATRNTEITMSSIIASDGTKLLAVSTVDEGSTGVPGEVQIYRYNTDTATWENNSTHDITSGAGAVRDAFGAALVFTSSSELLVGAPTYSGVDSTTLQAQGAYSVKYNSTSNDWGTVHESYNTGQRILYATQQTYLQGFGENVAVDGNLAVISGTNVDSGLLVYAYLDKDNDNNYEWEYISKLEFNNTSEIEACLTIWDIAIDNETVVVSVVGETGQMIYVFDDVKEGRADTYESARLSYNGYDESEDQFGRDVTIDAGTIFVTNQNDGGTAEVYGDDSATVYAYTYDAESGKWGTFEVDSDVRSESYSMTVSTGQEVQKISIDVEKETSSQEHTLVVGILGSVSNSVVIYENLTSTNTDDTITLSFDAAAHGSAPETGTDFGSSVAIQGDTIVIGIQDYQSGIHHNMGAIAVYQGTDNAWLTGEGSLTAVLTLDTASNPCNANLGSSGLIIGANNEVLASAGTAGNYYVYGWNLSTAINTSSVEILSTPDRYERADNSNKISSIAYSTTGKSLILGSDAASKGVSGVSETGAASTFDVTNHSPDDPIVVTLNYAGGTSSGDMGDIVVTFNQEVYLADPSSGITVIITELPGGTEQTVNIPYSEAEAMFNSEHTQLTVDFNNALFSFLKDGVQYSTYIASNVFKDSDGYMNEAPISFNFTVSEGEVIVDPTNPNNPNNPTNNGNNNEGDNDADLGNGSGLGNDTGTGLELDDPLGEIGEEAGLGDADEPAEGDNGESEDNAENQDGEQNGDQDNGDGNDGGESAAEGQQDNDAPAQTFNSPSGPAESMIIQNPFAEIITSREVQILFDSTLQAFSSLGIDSGTAYDMIQDAMGDTMTTAALVSSCEQVLESARELLAEVTDIDINEFSLSGSGMTAEAHSINAIIENAAANMVQARGNALIANDLLRILTINIKGFDNRLAENSFSAGVKRLAACNEELAYNYEILNSILRMVKASKEAGQIITVDELSAALPMLRAEAHETSLSISERGDRASQDVLAFLTRRLQNSGVDKENLQAQVSNIFHEWHNNLGLSAPININDTLDADVASIELLPAGAL